MSVNALLFDFDGTIVDTESAAYRSWQELFGAHGQSLALNRWVAAVGTLDGFDPLDELERLVGAPVDRASLEVQQLERERELGEQELMRAGVPEYLERARQSGLGVGIVTSSSTTWVTRHLERLNLADRWDCIVAANGDAAIAKPRPTLYLRALELLELESGQAVAIEDSPNGVRAAKAAGLYCVAVPNPVTAGLDLSAADVVVEALTDLPLVELLSRAEQRRAR